MSMLWKNGFFIPSISKVGDALPATVLYNAVLGALSPEQVMTGTDAAPGTAPSIYAILSGKPEYNLEYYSNEDGGDRNYYFRPQKSINGGLAGSRRPLQVCKSWIYFTDEVLIPGEGEKIKNVEPVQIPEILPWESGDRTTSPGVQPQEPPVVTAPDVAPLPEPVQVPQEAAGDIPPGPSQPDYCVVPDPALIPAPPGAVAPALSTVPEATAPAPSEETCNTTFIDAARSAGLGILATALSQPSIQSQLPNPSQPNTLFAPVDTAFFSMLSDLGISITDALGLGDKLTGVILYHIHPFESLSTEEIRQQQSLTTELGVRMNDESKYAIGVQSDPTATKLTSLKPGDIATITQEVQVCSAWIQIIDKVLVPAASVAELPSPTPLSTSPTTRTLHKMSNTTSKDFVDTFTGILNGGVASITGQLTNCLVEFVGPDYRLNTTTDSAGKFFFQSVPKCAINSGVVQLPVGDRQLPACVDNSTGLAPTYTLIASLSNLLGNLSTFPSEELPLNLDPLSTLLSSVALGNSSADGMNEVTDQIASLIGFSDAQSAVLGDFVQNLVNNGSPNIDLNAVLANSQALMTALLGGRTISNILPEINLDKAVEAINNVIAGGLQKLLDLSDASSIETVINQALDSFGGVLTGSLTNRKLLQNITSEALVPPASQSIAGMNALIKERAFSDAYVDKIPGDLAGYIAGCVKVAQTQLMPAINGMSNGSVSPEEFNTSFGSTNELRKAVEMQITPMTVEEPVLISPSPEPVEAPTTNQSSSAHMTWSSFTVSVIVAVVFMFS